jgi:FKBP-type peptidyl-prolyl cis-trans isomerase
MQRRRAFVLGIEPLECRAMLYSVAGDFNGDGVADLAIGIPSQTVGGVAGAGAVQILYGTAPHGGVKTGLTTLHDQLLSRANLGIRGSQPHDGDTFGAALAVGDFNHDGIADLAIGAPGQSVGGADGAGAVYILFGSHGGLRRSGAHQITENSRIIAGTAAAGDHFGAALAAGDFNHDQFMDLAIGLPDKTVRGHDNAGAVDVIYGSLFGLASGRSKTWTQSRLRAGTIGDSDLFGSSLVAGDFNGDGFRDLAVGAPGQTVGGQANAGAVSVIYGQAGGLAAARNQFWTADSNGVGGAATAGGQFGFSLAAGDFNGDRKRDLAIGAPGEDVAVTGGLPVTGAGAVHILLGSRARLTATHSQLWTENNLGLTGAAAATGDRFGQSLAAGGLNADRLTDLAIGAPGAAVSGSAGAGLVDVLYAAHASNSQPAGLATAGSQQWDQHKLTASGDDVAANEAFGSSLAIGDFNGDRLRDLAVEVPGESFNNSEPGSANAIFGSSNGTGLNAGGTNSAEQFQIWLPSHKAIFPDVVFQAFFNNPTRAANNLKAGKAFLAANKTKPGVITLADGLEYRVITSHPTGATPTDSNSVSVIYTGSLINGTVFDDSRNHPDPGTTDQTSFSVSGVVPGFAEALKLMHVGERIKVFIPSNLAYGTQGQFPSVPPNSVLIFDIELVSIS